MAMNLGPGDAKDPDVMIDINTTPLIDVMLVLLIMLIITIPIQTHAVKLDMPVNQPPPEQPLEPRVVNLEIDFDGTVIWDGTTIPDRASLEQRLRYEARQLDQAEFHIRPNKLVEYKYVAGVLASAQRLGVTKIGLVGNEQFLQ
jgi:biopolymer transport protein ExbD